MPDDSLASIMRRRRSVRAFTAEPVPDAVIEACIDLAIVAPSSHNLECWEFIDVVDPAKLARLRHFCLDQPQAQAARRLLVAVARPDWWRKGCDTMLLELDALQADPRLSASERAYLPRLQAKYRLLVPALFADGPLHILSPLRRLLLWIRGWFKPTMAAPSGRHAQQLWAVKTAALACQNFMLALVAQGYDSCPMEGFDEPRTKRLLKLPGAARVVMILAVGQRAEGGIIPQIRFPRSHYYRRA